VPGARRSPRHPPHPPGTDHPARSARGTSRRPCGRRSAAGPHVPEVFPNRPQSPWRSGRVRYPAASVSEAPPSVRLSCDDSVKSEPRRLRCGSLLQIACRVQPCETKKASKSGMESVPLYATRVGRAPPGAACVPLCNTWSRSAIRAPGGAERRISRREWELRYGRRAGRRAGPQREAGSGKREAGSGKREASSRTPASAPRSSLPTSPPAPRSEAPCRALCAPGSSRW